MRRPSNLAASALIRIVDALQQHLYLDHDSRGAFVWHPHKEWDAAGVCDQLASLLAQHGLTPTEPTHFIPEAFNHSTPTEPPSESSP